MVIPGGGAPFLFVVQASRLHDSTAIEEERGGHPPGNVIPGGGAPFPFVVQASRLHDSTVIEEVRAGRPHHNIAQDDMLR